MEGARLVPLPAVDSALAREGIAFYQVASHLFRNGLYGDEEQIAPEARKASNVPRRVEVRNVR